MGYATGLTGALLTKDNIGSTIATVSAGIGVLKIAGTKVGAAVLTNPIVRTTLNTVGAAQGIVKVQEAAFGFDGKGKELAPEERILRLISGAAEIVVPGVDTFNDPPLFPQASDPWTDKRIPDGWARQVDGSIVATPSRILPSRESRIRSNVEANITASREARGAELPSSQRKSGFSEFSQHVDEVNYGRDAGGVTVYRVDELQYPRIVLGEDRSVLIPHVTTKSGNARELFINVDQLPRAEFFLRKRIQQGKPAVIKAFEVEQSFVDDLRAQAVLESEVNKLPGPKRPVRVDLPKPGGGGGGAPDQYGLKTEEHIESLRKAIIPGTGRLIE